MDLKLRAVPLSPLSSALPNRLFLAFSDDEDPAGAAPPDLAIVARATGKARGFAGEAGSTLLVPGEEGQLCWVGLGKRAALTRAVFADSVAKGFAALREVSATRFVLKLPEPLPWPASRAARYAAEALWMTAYSFDRYRTRGTRKPEAEIELAARAVEEAKAGVAEAAQVGRAIALTRDLVNEPAAVAHTEYLTEQARQVAERVGARIRIIAGDALQEQGYGAIHAVGRAAEHPPALVALEVGKAGKKNSPSLPTLALVGKGVTFDTGGLDLKPSNYMALMKKDMGGAATALGAFQAIASLGLPLHLVCVLGLAENAVGPKSYRPGDILTSKAGLTMEITNTDAEGRVVLADALALAREYRPRWMVDFATLTGACRIALGKDIMGLFCDDAALTEALRTSAAETGEAVWPLPLWAPYRKKMESPVADMVNATADGMAGAITAALFLQEFANPAKADGSVAWAHLDCYGWSDGDTPLYPKGGSGAGVRLMVDLAERLGALT